MIDFGEKESVKNLSSLAHALIAQVFTDSKTKVTHVDAETRAKILEMLPNSEATNNGEVSGIIVYG